MQNPSLRRFVGNIEKNLPLIGRSKRIGELTGIHAGRPAIVAGAGLSLLKTLDALQNRGTAVLFACDRARDALLRAGIRPDYIVASDVTEAIAGFINEPGVETETLLASTYAAPEILAFPWKEIVFFNTADDDPSYMKRVNALCGAVDFLPGALLVSNFAFLLAERMGCGPVAFVGTDFYAPEPEPSWLRPDAGYVDLKLADGRRFHTLKVFLLALDWMENYLAARERAGRPTRAFNCSEGGIFYSDRLQGMTLTEFLNVRAD